MDVEDDALVLGDKAKFVTPEQANFIVSSPYPIEVEDIHPGIPVSAFVNSTSVMKVWEVEQIEAIEYTEINIPQIVAVPVADGSCLCPGPRLGYVVVKVT